MTTNDKTALARPEGSGRSPSLLPTGPGATHRPFPAVSRPGGSPAAARRTALFVVGVLTILFVLAGPAHAASGSQTFSFVFSADPHTGTPGRVIATGVVNAVGTDGTIAAHPNPDGSLTNTDRITLPQGTITIVDTDPAGIVHFDPVTCIARISGSGPFSVTGGTGSYGGASGSGMFTANGLIVFSRTAKGCSDKPLSFFAFVTAKAAHLTIPGL